MSYFDMAALRPADILAGRGHSRYARAIRGALGSLSNHNALIVPSAMHGPLAVGDTVKPVATVVPLSHYADLITAGLYNVRIWRVRDLSAAERTRIALRWYVCSDGQAYANHSIYKLAIFRLINNLPWRLRIHGTWCTENTARPFSQILPAERDPLRKPDGRMKHNPTPRTYENRLVAGVLEDVTSQVLVPGAVHARREGPRDE